MGSNGSVWVFMRPYETLWVLIDPYRFLTSLWVVWVLIGLYASLWVIISPFPSLCVFMGHNGSL